MVRSPQPLQASYNQPTNPLHMKVTESNNMKNRAAGWYSCSQLLLNNNYVTPVTSAVYINIPYKIRLNQKQLNHSLSIENTINFFYFLPNLYLLAVTN